MLLEIIKTIIGIPLIFFVPGYIIEIYFLKSKTLIEKIVVSITISIAITIALGLLLGVLKIFNYWTSLSGFVIIILGTIAIAKIKEINLKKISRQKNKK